ncbi:MAG TPA: lipid A deacylase LpxR family protein [Verrucomicrobiae bacterium]|nr:lipid A deacylase LpxR family protein [Verrucomicrobiae bacterium]
MRCALILFLAGVLSAAADNAWEGQILSFTMENDALTGHDRHFTSGAHVQYESEDNALYDWTRSMSRLVPAFGFDLQAQKWAVEVGQQIYTPEDLDARTVVKGDRPYAAWLYGRAALQRRGPGPGSSLAMEWFGLDVGVVGPEALGEEAQSTFHGDAPNGWQNQLDTEVTVGLRYLRRQLWEYRFNDWRLHLIPFVDAAGGTADTHVGGGALVRFGYNVPNEFEVAHGTTAPDWGAYVFSGLEGRWVIRNLFLEGNTFRSSHGVDKEPLIGDFSFGVGLVFKRVEVLLSHTLLTHEFKAQHTDDSFSSATVLFKF